MSGVEAPLRALHAFVRGQVQGVGFRDFTQRQARRLGLSGYVRNLHDGRVEVWAEGPADALEQLLQALRQGPPAARVEGVEVRWGHPTGRHQGFSIAY